MGFEFRISFTHLIDDEVGYLVKEQALEAEGVPPLIDRSPHDLAQHIVAAFVRRQNSIGDRESSRARMIGDHAHGKAFLSFSDILSIRELGDEFNDVP